MKQGHIALYLISMISGIYSYDHIIACFFPIIYYFLVIDISLLLLILFYLLGLILIYLFPLLPMTFAICSGSVEYIGKNKIYMVQTYANNQNISKILTINTKDQNIEIGDKLTISALFFKNNAGKLIKILKQYKVKRLSFLQKTRITIRNFLLNSEYSEVFDALILGDRTYINFDRMNSFKNTGIFHLLAISGIHIYILMNSMFIFIQRLLCCSFFLYYRINNHFIALIFSITSGLLYLFISMFPLSGIRAFIMFLFHMFFPKVLNRNKVLFLTAFIMIIHSPYIVYDYSFILSFLCTWAVMKNNQNITDIVIPFIPKWNICSIWFNFIVIRIFNIVLPVLILSILFQSQILLFCADILFCFIDLISQIPIKSIRIFMPQNIKVIYLFFISFSIITDEYLYIKIIFMFTVILSVLFNLFQTFGL